MTQFDKNDFQYHVQDDCDTDDIVFDAVNDDAEEEQPIPENRRLFHRKMCKKKALRLRRAKACKNNAYLLHTRTVSVNEPVYLKHNKSSSAQVSKKIQSNRKVRHCKGEIANGNTYKKYCSVAL